MKGFEITHPDRVLFPKGNFTKLDLANYYEKAARLMMPPRECPPLSKQQKWEELKEAPST